MDTDRHRSAGPLAVRMRIVCAGACGLLWLAGCARAPEPQMLAAATGLATGAPSQLAARPPQISVAAGESIVVSARQRDIDVVLELRAADGRVLARSAAPAADRGREWLIWQAPTAADVQVRVAIAAGAAAAPSSRIELQLLRAQQPWPERVRRAWSAQRELVSQPPAAELASLRWQELAREWRDLDEPGLAAEASLQRAALEYADRQQWTEAARAAEQARAGFEALGDAALQADASLLLGAARAEQAAVDPKADGASFTAPLELARRIHQRLGAPVAAAEAVNFRGAAEFNRGDAEAAATFFAQAADEFERAGAPARHQLALLNLASSQFDRGDYRGAAGSFDQLLAAWKSDDAAYHAVLLLNGGWSLAAIGEPERALARYLEALDVAGRTKDSDLTARALHGLGIVHQQLGQTKLAISYLRQAVGLAQSAGNAISIAAWRDDLGGALRADGQVELAAREHAAALGMIADSGRKAVRGRVLLSLARDHYDAGQHDAALRRFDAVLSLALPEGSTVAIRARTGRAAALAALGRRRDAVQDLDRAIALAAAQELIEEGSLALAERARLQQEAGATAAALADSERAVALTRRLTAAATNPDNRVTYSLRVRAILDQHIDLLVRQGRALDALVVADLANTRGIWARSGEPEAPAESAKLYEMLAERRHRLESLAEKGDAPDARMRSIEAEMAVLRSRLARARGSDDAAVRAPARDLRQLPAAVGRGDVLLVYSIARDRGWLWLVRGTGVQLIALPGRDSLDRAVRRLLDRVRRLEPYGPALDALRGAVLPDVGPDVLAGKRLLVVADGALGAVPWALLQSKLEATAVLQLARASDVMASPATPGSPVPRRGEPAGWRWALFGDPAFGREAGSPARLPGTVAELAAVAAWSKPGLHQVFVGTDATRDALLSLPTGQVDVLHVATHASLDAAVPELAALALARVDAQGRRIAGDVRAADLLAWRSAPRLVVLSACDAAAEPSNQAAGLMSLTRALLARGSQHVVASLWPVADAAAVDFMNAFYAALVQGSMPPDRALAEAQRTLAGSKRWQAPFFWAGFVVHGAGP